MVMLRFRTYKQKMSNHMVMLCFRT